MNIVALALWSKIVKLKANKRSIKIILYGWKVDLMIKLDLVDHSNYNIWDLNLGVTINEIWLENKILWMITKYGIFPSHCQYQSDLQVSATLLFKAIIWRLKAV